MITNRWQDSEAETFTRQAGDDPADQDLALRVYTSRLIGQEPDLVMHGGGNTSCKTMRPDLFGQQQPVLHVKGSGWDLEVIEGAGLPAVRLEPLQELRKLAQLSDEDMVNMQRCNLLDSTAPNPSVETLLHAYLPHKFIDHTHATAFLVLANLPNAKEVCAELFGNKLAVVDYIMPGFLLSKAAAEVYEANPEVEGLLLLGHGHFAFGDSAKESYDRIIEHTNIAAAHFGMLNPTTIGERNEPTDTSMLPALRGVLGRMQSKLQNDEDVPMPVLDLRNSAEVMSFLERNDVDALAMRGVASPDHVIRTKGQPLVLPESVWRSGADAIEEAVEQFAERYRDYFQRQCSRLNESRTMLSPLPFLAWIESVGLVGIGATAKAASVAADIGEQNMRVRATAEDAGGFYPVGENDLFDLEYWSLEQAKLGKSKAPAFAGRVVMITGAAGAIGASVAKAFAAEGASLVLLDSAADSLEELEASLGSKHRYVCMDITADIAAQTAMQAAVAAFGGLDVLVSNAGSAPAGLLDDMSDEDMRRSFELNFFAPYKFANEAAKLFKEQGRGGQILFNISKQAVNPGKAFGAYGLPKASTLFLMRQLALELGESGVRVNGVNADRIRSGILNPDFIKTRAEARSVSESDYMAGNLLGREVEAEHVAAAFVALAKSERTTSHVMTVDGGNVEAALR